MPALVERNDANMMPGVDLKFEAPGVGTWVLDTQHYPTPMTRFIAEIIPQTIARGQSETVARYGQLMVAKMIPINGFHYARRHMVGTEPGSNKPPSVDNPEVKKLLALAAERLRTKYWLEERRQWFEEVKPDSIRINLALASVDVTGLGRAELFDHLSTCRDNTVEMCMRHHTFNQAAMAPAAFLMADVTEWTDLSPADATSLLDGASPISIGITPELEALAWAIREDVKANALIRSDADPAEILAQMRALPEAVGETMNRFWLMDGHRLATGFDVSAKCAYELPEMLLHNIKNSVESGPPDRTAEAEAVARFVRKQVPPEHRATFDEELADARASIAIKDERGLYNDVWANGIARKALLEAGQRLVDDGRLHDREHFMEADWEEMGAIWDGTGGPLAAELGERRETRMSLTWQDAPPFLGPPPSPPAAIEGLPPEALRWNQAAAAMALAMRLGPPETQSDDLTGTVASQGQYEGTARVVVGDYSFDKIQTGDVLVTSTHSEAFNAVVQRLGAIVADTGGPLSHLSIVSREIGIPCIVSCRNATRLIKDGDRVSVDGESGRVTILE